MNFDTAAAIFQAMSRTSCEEFRESLIRAGVQYASKRVECALLLMGERGQIEDARTRAHDVFIDACNILSRAMAQKGEDNSWRQTLGQDRREIGDFACFLTAIIGLKVR